MKVPGIPFVQGRNAYTDTDGVKYGIAIHNTANDATAANEASYATRRTDGVSAHFYVDDKEVIQSLDTNSRAGHAGSTNGNQHAIAVEITGVNGWTRTQWLNNVAWGKLGEVLAIMCKTYGIAVRRASITEMKANPRIKAFYSHNDMRLAWAGTTHTDPGSNFPWDRLFAEVNAALTPQGGDMQLSDKVSGTSNPNRTVKDILMDLSNLRDFLVGTQSVPTPPDPGSPLQLLHALGKAYPHLATEVSTIKASVMADDAPLAEIRLLVAELAARPRVSADDIAAAIPDGIAEDVANLLVARLSS